MTSPGMRLDLGAEENSAYTIRGCFFAVIGTIILGAAVLAVIAGVVAVAGPTTGGW